MQTANEVWLKSIRDVMIKGDIVFPRGLETKEILNYTVSFDMNEPICHHHNRKLSYKFMAAEAYWITSGSPLVEDIAPYNKHIAKFSDDGYIFNGAYGPAFLSQLNFTVKTLINDSNSRQAVMTIWHPNPIDTKDHKCTIALVFNIRDATLHTTVLMRSNDMILGRPYDMFNFTVMTLKVLTEINKYYGCTMYSLGSMTFHAVSAHIYATDYECVDNILVNVDDYSVPHGIPTKAFNNWQYVVDSLLCCREGVVDKSLWQIRPEV